MSLLKWPQAPSWSPLSLAQPSKLSPICNPSVCDLGALCHWKGTSQAGHLPRPTLSLMRLKGETMRKASTMKAREEEARSLTIRNPPPTRTITSRVSMWFAWRFINLVGKIPHGMKYNNKKKLYCICQQEYQSGILMFFCEGMLQINSK